MVREGGIHAVSMGITEGTGGARLPNGVRVLRDSLLGLGLLLGTGGFGLFGLPRVHATVWGTREGSITTGRTFAGHTLTRLLLSGSLALAELRDFLTK